MLNSPPVTIPEVVIVSSPILIEPNPEVIDPASNAPTVVILLLPAFNENVAVALSVVIREFN